MGGNVFKDRTRRANQQDKANFLEYITKLSGLSADNFKFIGSSASSSKTQTFGDLDVGVFLGQNSKELFTEMVKERLETVEKMGALYVLFDGVQVDLNFVNNLLIYKSWIIPASTVPFLDPFKALYRNEVLFHIVEHFYSTKILKIEDGRVHTFQRPRFTITEGLLDTTYTYKSEAGNWLTKPIKIKDEIADYGHDFDTFMRIVFGLQSSRDKYEPTFINLLGVINTRIGSRDAYFYLTKIRNGLEKKGALVPDVLLNFIEVLEPWK